MTAYILRRLLLIIPTLFGILLINFAIVQFAPGGPVEQTLAELRGRSVGSTERFSGGGGGEVQTGPNRTSASQSSGESRYRGARGLDPELVQRIEKMYGFDRPAHERFWKMLVSYATFDFGQSFFRDRSVVQLIVEKMPVSITLGLWSTLLVYLVSIPLGIMKAVRSGSRFDVVSSALVLGGYAIPGFLLAIMLVVVFSGGSFVQWFPLRGLTSANFSDLSWWGKALDYLWHATLPTIALVVGGFAGLTMLTKNCFLEEIRKQYVVTARAKGADENQVLYGHVFRNAMLLIVAGFPAAFASILFTGALLVEVIFSLDGLGLLGFESAIRRDYPVMFGTLYIFGLLGLVMNIVGDVMYTVVDPRIDFEGRS